MRSDKPLFRLADMLENIDRIRSYTVNNTIDRFVSDPKCQDAVERCLLRISEAARKLEDITAILMPTNRGRTFVPWETYFVTSMTPSIPTSYGTLSRMILDH